jgi:predicted ATPase
MLAGVYAKLTQSEEGLRVVQDAFQVMEKKGERMAETELYRIKGELTLQQQFQVPSSKFQVSNPQPLTPNPQHPTPSTQAEAYFLRAIDIARQRGAKSFELRATVSLARLWQQQGKQHAARNTLSEIYGWFTEGFATADLQEAKHLLAEMARS